MPSEDFSSLDCALTAVATYLNERTNHRAGITDLVFYRKHWQAKLKAELDESHPDWVGISVNKLYLPYAKEVVKEVRQLGYPILVGGHEVSVNADEVEKILKPNALYVGDSETMLGEALTELDKFDEPPLSIHPLRFTASFCDNLDDLPTPDWSLWKDLDKYYYYLGMQYMIGSRGCPYKCQFCHDYDNPILTDKGVKRIGDVATNPEGYKVIDKDGNWVNVLQGFAHDYEGPMITVKAYGLPPIKVTPNHKFITPTGIKEARALIPIRKNIPEGDYLLVPGLTCCAPPSHLPINEICHDSIYDSKGWYLPRSKTYLSSIEITPDFCELVGLYLAEGHVNFAKNRLNSGIVVWTFNKKEIDIQQRTIELVKSCFGLDAKTLQTTTATQIIVNNSLLANIFKDLFGHSADTKHLPYEWLQWPKRYLARFLIGYFKGDGCLRKNNGAWQFISTSFTLLNQIVMIVASWGAKASLHQLRPAKSMVIEGRTVNAKQTWRLSIGREELALAVAPITVEVGSWRRVIKVTAEDFSGKVYNLKTETGTVCVGGIAQKNCDAHGIAHKVDGNYFRLMDPIHYASQLSDIWQSYGVQMFHLFDPVFTIKKEWVKDFCNDYEDYIHIPFSVFSRVDHIDEERVYHLWRAGCKIVRMGIEAGDEHIRHDVYQKKVSNEQIMDAVRLVKSHGMAITAYYILGGPYENKQTVQKTIDLAKELDCERTVFFVYKVLTEEGEKQMLDCGAVLHPDTSDNITFGAVAELPGLSSKRLLGLQRKAYLYTLSKRLSRLIRVQRISYFTRLARYLYEGRKDGLNLKYLLAYFQVYSGPNKVM